MFIGKMECFANAEKLYMISTFVNKIFVVFRYAIYMHAHLQYFSIVFIQVKSTKITKKNLILIPQILMSAQEIIFWGYIHPTSPFTI